MVSEQRHACFSLNSITYILKKVETFTFKFLFRRETDRPILSGSLSDFGSMVKALGKLGGMYTVCRPENQVNDALGDIPRH